jgi:DNA (cytosine-5)-methyltransferase 1
MRYLSVCSGIEAATMAWHPLGWEPVAFSEIEAFPSAVLAHHYPDVPNLGDMTKFQEWPDLEPDVLVGGTPCQSFSVAGLRKGLDDPRGNLMLTYLAIAHRYRPRWVVWENVPGVLSSNKGRDFASLLRGLAELGYGWAYRILDAQYFGVPQRRRRVFVVGCLGSWQRAAAVLFERASLCGHPAPRRETRKDVATTIAARTRGGGGLGSDFDCDGGLIAGCMEHQAHGGITTQAALSGYITPIACDVADSLTVGANQTTDFVGDVVAHSLRASGFDASEDGTGRGTPLVPIVMPTLRCGGNDHADHHNIVPIAFNWQASGKQTTLGANTLGANTSQAVAFNLRGRDGGAMPEVSDVASLRAASGGSSRSYVGAIGWSEELTAHHDLAGTVQRGGDGGRHEGVMTPAMQVRRLTPRECERLQGFPDDYTLITHRKKPAADDPRYKALGNSMAVPVMAWIGRRIAAVNAIE